MVRQQTAAGARVCVRLRSWSHGVAPHGNVNSRDVYIAGGGSAVHRRVISKMSTTA